MDKSLTLKPLFSSALSQQTSKLAVSMESAELTYGGLRDLSHQAGNAFKKLGAKPNVRIGLWLSNCVEYVVADMGIIQVGSVKVPLNNMLAEKEVLHILRDAGVQVLVVGKEFLSAFQGLQNNLPELKTVIVVDADEPIESLGYIQWDEFLAMGSTDPVDSPVQRDDMAVIMYTGGTTGLPKGVVHRQAGIVLNLFSHIMELGIQDDERLLLNTPLPHSAGFLLKAGLLKGASHFVEKTFDAGRMLRRLTEDRITLTFMVPTMIYRVLDEAAALKLDPLSFPDLRTIVYGAAPITLPRLKEGLTLFGPVFMQLYGQTEAPNFITRMRREEHRLDGDYAGRLTSCGQPVLMGEVRIVDEQGHELPRGIPGELTARTPYTMEGYHGQPQKTEETLKDGWLYTGDVAYMDDDNFVYLMDRKKDMVISGGMNVYTTEVENVIQRFPGVKQVAVIGVPHPDWGEAVLAMVVSDSENPPDTAQLFVHCEKHLAKYKRPKEIKLVDSFPLTPYGKVDKKALRAPYWANVSRNIH